MGLLTADTKTGLPKSRDFHWVGQDQRKMALLGWPACSKLDLCRSISLCGLSICSFLQDEVYNFFWDLMIQQNEISLFFLAWLLFSGCSSAQDWKWLHKEMKFERLSKCKWASKQITRQQEWRRHLSLQNYADDIMRNEGKSQQESEFTIYTVNMQGTEEK